MIGQDLLSEICINLFSFCINLSFSYVCHLFRSVFCCFHFGSGPQGLVVRDGYVKATKAAGNASGKRWKQCLHIVGNCVCCAATRFRSGQHQGMDLPFAKIGFLMLSLLLNSCVTVYDGFL